MRKDYYVYKHTCPVTRELLYIGKGCNTRAWEFNGDRTKLNHAFGTRYKDHSDFLRRLVNGGYLPCDWVSIIRRQLTNSEAHAVEADLIQKHTPKFNKLKGGGMAKFNAQKIRKMLRMRKEGKSTYAIASVMGCSASTAYRIVTQKCKYYGKYYK